MNGRDTFWAIVIMLVGGYIALHGGCSYGGGRYGYEDAYDDTAAAEYAADRDLDAALQDDDDESGDEADSSDSGDEWWSDAPLATDAADVWDERGYPCTIDCSGHDAGYEWAQDNGITDPGECSGNSQSFIEGCEAWAEEQ